MSRNAITAALVAVGLSLMAAPGWARVGVEVWTDRGQDAVYKPGDLMQVKVRPSTDAYLLVYEIDTDGYVRVLYPFRGQSGYVEGRRTLRVPDADSNVELVVERNTGEAYIVALASEEPFEDMPWYLRPYDARSEGVAYEGGPRDDEGVTEEGRIVGDPFVAMERIRRSVLRSPEDPESFGSSYTSYYVHERVRYPRYLCNDCHRPGRWAWWDGFDPYYSTCSVVDFRINWGWSWGPNYWFGHTPYFCYVLRDDCAPRWRRGWNGPWYSSWDGWGRWTTMWGGPLVRYKSPPPPGYIPPNKYDDPDRWRGGARPLPPGFLANTTREGRYRPMIPVGANRQARDEDGSTPTTVGRTARPGADRQPGREVRGGDERRQGEPVVRPRREERPLPSTPARGDDGARAPRGHDRPSAAPAPREDRRAAPQPSYQPPREERRSQPAPAPASPPREERAEKSSPPPPPPPPPPAPKSDGGGRERRGGR